MTIWGERSQISRHFLHCSTRPGQTRFMMSSEGTESPLRSTYVGGIPHLIPWSLEWMPDIIVRMQKCGKNFNKYSFPMNLTSVITKIKVNIGNLFKRFVLSSSILCGFLPWFLLSQNVPSETLKMYDISTWTSLVHIKRRNCFLFILNVMLPKTIEYDNNVIWIKPGYQFSQTIHYWSYLPKKFPKLNYVWWYIMFFNFIWNHRKEGREVRDGRDWEMVGGMGEMEGGVSGWRLTAL